MSLHGSLLSSPRKLCREKWKPQKRKGKKRTKKGTCPREARRGSAQNAGAGLGRRQPPAQPHCPWACSGWAQRPPRTGQVFSGLSPICIPVHPIKSENWGNAKRPLMKSDDGRSRSVLKRYKNAPSPDASEKPHPQTTGARAEQGCLRLLCLISPAVWTVDLEARLELGTACFWASCSEGSDLLGFAGTGGFTAGGVAQSLDGGPGETRLLAPPFEDTSAHTRVLRRQSQAQETSCSQACTASQVPSQ